MLSPISSPYTYFVHNYLSLTVKPTKKACRLHGSLCYFSVHFYTPSFLLKIFLVVLEKYIASDSFRSKQQTLCNCLILLCFFDAHLVELNIIVYMSAGFQPISCVAEAIYLQRNGKDITYNNVMKSIFELFSGIYLYRCVEIQG